MFTPNPLNGKDRNGGARWKWLAVFSFYSVSAFANYSAQVSVLLNAGATTVTVQNSGTVGAVQSLQFSPGAGQRVRFTISPIYVAPPSGTTYSVCGSPCIVSVNRERGQQYFWVEYVDSSGNPFSPRLISEAGGAHNTNTCGGMGTLPMVEPAITTTSPLPMPIEVIGQDCFVKRVQLPLKSGHGTAMRLAFTIHAPTYNVLVPGRFDGKAEVSINGGAWEILNEANANLAAVDEERYRVWDGNSGCVDCTGPTGGFGTLRKMGGQGMVRYYILSGFTIGAGDTTIQIAWRFRGTDGIGSGFRILEMAVLENTDIALTNINKSGSTSVASSVAHGLSTSDDVFVRGAPGMRMVFDGLRDISAVTSDTFTFANCTYSSGGSNVARFCTLPDGDWAPPINRNPNTRDATTQAVMYAAKMMVDDTALTYPAPDTSTPPAGGNATTGENLFKTGNEAGTPGEHNLVVPVFPYTNYTTTGQCASCHFSDGKDLKYFNSSNDAIGVRSVFHGLTPEQGDHIAAYIRSLTQAVPPQARPWNPPFQTGPGMADGTYRIGSGLTNIVVSSNVATANLTSDPTGIIAVGDPVCIQGATVDADLLKCFPATGVTSSTVTFTTASVGNATYNESTLLITMANNFAAGCGIDCVGADGYATMLASISDTSTWLFDANVEPRTIVYPYQFPDWNRHYLPVIYPPDVYPSADYLNSAPYDLYQANLAITTGDFASYKASNYTLDDGLLTGRSMFRHAQLYAGNDTNPEPGEGNIPFSQYMNGQWVTAGAKYPSQWNLYRQAVFSTSNINILEMMIGKQLFGFYGQMMTDLKGAATATGCHPVWGIPGKSQFWMGPHVEKMYPGTEGAGWESDHENLSNRWYDMATAVGTLSCFDVPQTMIDASYLEQFHDLDDRHRANGYVATMLDVIVVGQAGRQNTDLGYHTTTHGADGLDWGSLLRRNPFTAEKAPSYYHYTEAAYEDVVAEHAAIIADFVSSRDGTYWRTVIDNHASGAGVSATDCFFSGGTTDSAAFWTTPVSGGTANPCNFVASFLTFWTMFGADSGDIATVKAWADALWTDHDFDFDIAAATEGDIGDYGTGDLSVAGSGKVITFSTTCPMNANGTGSPNSLTVGGGGGRYEFFGTFLGNITGGTCVRGSPGTIVVTTAYPHSSGWKATSGCSTANRVPNSSQNFVQTATGWFRCKNMF